MRFDLSKGFPLVTTRKVFFKGIIRELLWFLAGDTNITLVAVPAFRRVDPVNTSGPTSGAMTKSGRPAAGIFKCGLKQINTVLAPFRRAAANAPHTKGVRPLAAMPMTMSRRLTPR